MFKEQTVYETYDGKSFISKEEAIESCLAGVVTHIAVINRIVSDDGLTSERKLGDVEDRIRMILGIIRYGDDGG